MNNRFDTLSEKQKEVAELIVEDAVERKRGGKKRTQIEIAEEVGITDRTIRLWKKDETFLAYLEYVSRLRIQAAMPDFAAVLITNLEKGQNVSTKQLDLIAKVADWLPEPKSSNNTLNIQIGTSDIEDRIKKLEERKMKVVHDVPQQQIEDVNNAD